MKSISWSNYIDINIYFIIVIKYSVSTYMYYYVPIYDIRWLSTFLSIFVSINFFNQFIHASIYLFSISQPYFYLFMYLLTFKLHKYMYLFIHYLSFYLFNQPYIYLFMYLPTYMYIYISISSSIYWAINEFVVVLNCWCFCGGVGQLG